MFSSERVYSVSYKVALVTNDPSLQLLICPNSAAFARYALCGAQV